MGVSLTDDEAWEFLARGHTAIFTTLRADGSPVSLPVWYAVTGRRVYLQTPAGAKKTARVRRDSRACLLAESGRNWAELAGVMLPARATVLSPGPEADDAADMLRQKYAAFRAPAAAVPAATKDRYADTVIIRMDPAGPIISWDNARIRRRGR
jgi:PPOX class probable F420-dependent enzyme